MNKLIATVLFASICATTTTGGVRLKVKSFQSDEKDLTARVSPRNDDIGNSCALVKVVIGEEDVTFECGNIASMIVGDVSFHTNEHWVYLVAGNGGAKHLKVKHPSCPTIDIVFSDYGINTLEPLTTYTIILNKSGEELQFSKLNQFYVDAFFQAGNLMGAGFAAGGHFHATNAELEFVKGLTKSDELFWYDQNKLISQSTYSTVSGNLKLGYGLKLNKKLHLTPQAGVGLVKCTSVGDNPGKDANAVYSLIGCRGTFVFAKHFQVVLSPCYNFCIKKSTSFKEISAIQSSINNWAHGFNIKVGLSIFF
jgi:hypothetical protein